MAGPVGLGLIPRTGPLRAPGTTAARPVAELQPTHRWQFDVGPLRAEWPKVTPVALAGGAPSNGQTVTTDPFDPPPGSRVVVMARATRANHAATFTWSATVSGGIGACTQDGVGADPGSNLFGRQSYVGHVDAGATPPTGVTVTIDAWSTADTGAYAWAVYCVPAGSFNPTTWLAQGPTFTVGTGGAGATATATLPAASTGLTIAAAFAEMSSGSLTWDPLEAGWFSLASRSDVATGAELVHASSDASGSTTLSATATDIATYEVVMLEVAPASGGTTFPQALAGTLTTGGALTRSTAQARAGTVTSAGAATKQARRAIPLGGASLPPAGTLARSTGKATAGTITSAGAVTVTKVALRAFAGSLALAATLTRSTTKTTAGTATSSATATRQTGKATAGTLTTSATLGVVRAILRAFAGTVTSTGTLARQTNRPVAGSTTPAATLTRSTAKPLAGTITSSATLARAKVALLSLAGALSSAGALTRRPGKALASSIASSSTLATARTFARALAGTLTTSATVTRSTAKALAGAVTSSGAVTRAKVALLAVAGALTSSATVTRRAGKSLAAVVATDGQLVRQPRKTVAGALTPAGTLTRARIVLLALAGAIAPTGVLARRTAKALAAGLAPVGGLLKRAARALAGAVGLAGTGTVAPVQEFVGRLNVLLQIQTLTRVQPAASTDGYGNTVLSYGVTATRTTFDGWLWQDTRAETRPDGRNPAEQRWQLMCNLAELDTDDRIEWPSGHPAGPLTFAIEGPPQPSYRAGSAAGAGGFHHTEASLRLLEG